MTRVLHVIENQTPEDMLLCLADLLGPEDQIVSIGPPPAYPDLGRPVRSVHCPMGSAFLAGRRMQRLPDTVDVIHAWSLEAARAVGGLADRPGVVVSLPCAEQAGQAAAVDDQDDHWPANLAVTLPTDHSRRLALANGLPERALHVLSPPGRAVDDPAATRDSVRRELDIGPQDIVLTAPLPMARDAGHVEAAWVHAIVWHIFPQAVLVLGGDGSGADHARRFAASLPVEGHVRVTGRRFSRRQLLAACDLALFFPDRDFSPASLADAMAAGRPIVACRTEQNQALLADGIDAILVPPRVIRLMADGVLRVLDDPALAARLGKAAAEKARHLFGLDVCRRQLDEVYQSVTAAETTKD